MKKTGKQSFFLFWHQTFQTFSIYTSYQYLGEKKLKIGDIKSLSNNNAFNVEGIKKWCYYFYSNSFCYIFNIFYIIWLYDFLDDFHLKIRFYYTVHKFFVVCYFGKAKTFQFIISNIYGFDILRFVKKTSANLTLTLLKIFLI